MKMICEVDRGITIWADESQYVLRIQKNPQQKLKHAENLYLSSLTACFQEVFEYLCRNRLADDRHKTIAEVAEIVRQTQKEIIGILAPFEELGGEIKGRQEAVEAGKAPLRDLKGTLSGRQ